MGWVVGRRDFSFRGGAGEEEEVFAVMVAVAYWRGRRVEVGVLVVRRREERARVGRCIRGGMVGNLFWGAMLAQLMVLGRIGVVTYG
jgi:hypothetical protein